MGLLSTVVQVLTRNYLLSRKLFAGAGSPGADTQVRSPQVWKDGRRSPLEVMVKGLCLPLLHFEYPKEISFQGENEGERGIN